MNTPFIKAHLKWLVPAGMLITVAVFCVPPAVHAKLAANTIDPQAIVTDNGRHLIVTGPIQGTVAGERGYVRVTVTQRSTGAVAEGSVAFDLTGAVEQWDVHATTQGKATFQPGPATVVAMARTTSRGNTSDAHQWLVNVTLVDQ
jgi:hypothetical protein